MKNIITTSQYLNVLSFLSDFNPEDREKLSFQKGKMLLPDGRQCEITIPGHENQRKNMQNIDFFRRISPNEPPMPPITLSEPTIITKLWAFFSKIIAYFFCCCSSAEPEDLELEEREPIKEEVESQTEKESFPLSDFLPSNLLQVKENEKIKCKKRDVRKSLRESHFEGFHRIHTILEPIAKWAIKKDDMRDARKIGEIFKGIRKIITPNKTCNLQYAELNTNLLRSIQLIQDAKKSKLLLRFQPQQFISAKWTKKGFEIPFSIKDLPEFDLEIIEEYVKEIKQKGLNHPDLQELKPIFFYSVFGKKTEVDKETLQTTFVLFLENLIGDDTLQSHDGTFHITEQHKENIQMIVFSIIERWREKYATSNPSIYNKKIAKLATESYYALLKCPDRINSHFQTMLYELYEPKEQAHQSPLSAKILFALSAKRLEIFKSVIQALCSEEDDEYSTLHYYQQLLHEELSILPPINHPSMANYKDGIAEEIKKNFHELTSPSILLPILQDIINNPEDVSIPTSLFNNWVLTKYPNEKARKKVTVLDAENHYTLEIIIECLRDLGIIESLSPTL